MITLKTAKRCMNCRYFDHEWMEDGVCLHGKQSGRRTNFGLICELYKKKKDKKDKK